MVRSHWIGPVFGVLALTGLAAGQTTTPFVPASTGDAEGQIVTVQEMGKPAQKCKVLKKWIEPDGAHAYQVQALETGEVLTIADAPATAPGAAHGGPPGSSPCGSSIRAATAKTCRRERPRRHPTRSSWPSR